MFDTREARRATAQLHGVRAAAWLLRSHREQLREVGAVEFVMPFGHRVPSWFQRAITVLRRRDAWRVRSYTTPKGNTWMVEWRAHKHATRSDAWPN